MKISDFFLLCFAAPLLAVFSTCVSVQTTSAVHKDVVLSDYGKLPLSFEANNGQTDRRVKFLSRSNDYSLFLTGNEAVIAVKKAEPQSPKTKGLPQRELSEPQKQTAAEATNLRMRLAGTNATPRIVGADELPGTVNYFIGNDPSKWRTNEPTYATVKDESIYQSVSQ